MTYEELKIQLDICDPEDVLPSIGRECCHNILEDNRWFVICDDGDCHLFKNDGTEDDIHHVTHIGAFMVSNIAFDKIIIPNSVIEIGDNAFSRCNELVDIVIPDSVKVLGHHAFCYCHNLENVTLPNSIQAIPAFAFEECTKLKNIVIPDSVKYISDYAFIGNDSLETMTISENIEYVGIRAFDECRKLNKVIFKGKTINEVKRIMWNYPWGIKDESVIKCA